MAKKKSGFDLTALLAYSEKLEELGGIGALKRATEAGLKQSKVEINKQVTVAMQKSNLPAGGKYSTGAALDSLDKDMAVKWEGNVATLPLGFDMSKSGIVSILLMYGTPKMRPASGLRDALYGSKVKRLAREAQEAAIQKIIERLGG